MTPHNRLGIAIAALRMRIRRLEDAIGRVDDRRIGETMALRTAVALSDLGTKLQAMNDEFDAL